MRFVYSLDICGILCMRALAVLVCKVPVAVRSVLKVLSRLHGSRPPTARPKTTQQRVRYCMYVRYLENKCMENLTHTVARRRTALNLCLKI